MIHLLDYTNKCSAEWNYYYFNNNWDCRDIRLFYLVVGHITSVIWEYHNWIFGNRGHLRLNLRQELVIDVIGRTKMFATFCSPLLRNRRLQFLLPDKKLWCALRMQPRKQTGEASEGAKEVDGSIRCYWLTLKLRLDSFQLLASISIIPLNNSKSNNQLLNLGCIL